MSKWAAKISEGELGYFTMFLGLMGLASGLGQKGYTYAAIPVAVVAFGALIWGIVHSR
jgi:hypothetical protein